MTCGDSMKFKRIYVEICNTCNLSCSFCVQDHKHPRMLGIDQFRSILDQIKPYTSYLYLHVLGEPLMHPELEEILSLCRKADMHVQLTTNGTLLKKAEPLLLRYPPRQINISVHSFSQQPAQMQERYMADVLHCGKTLSAQGTYVSYRLWCKQDGKLAEREHRLMEQICSFFDRDVPVQMNRSIVLGNRCFLSFDEVFEWPSLSHPYVSDRGTCRGLRDMIAILSDGSVVPCCLDAYAQECLGNVFEQSFAQILQGERLNEIRDGFLRHRLCSPLCRRCAYRIRFR